MTKPSFCADCVKDHKSLTKLGISWFCPRCAPHHTPEASAALDKLLKEVDAKAARDYAAARESQAAWKLLRRLAPGEVLKQGRALHIPGGNSTLITTLRIDHRAFGRGKS
jgi:hypothetical protein